MEFNRNRYFLIGMLLLMLGIQFRMVHSFVLNETSTRALAKVVKSTKLASQDLTTDLYLNTASSPKKTVRPPKWLGWILLTSGGIIFLHAIVLPKPKG